jgi:bacillolysin
MKKYLFLCLSMALTNVVLAQKPIKTITPAPNRATTKEPLTFERGTPAAESPFGNGSIEIQSVNNFAKPNSLPQGLAVAYTVGGLPRQIEGVLPPSFANEKTVESRALQYLTAVQKAMGIKNANNEWTITSSETDDLGQTHTRLQQKFDNIPVWGGEAIVHEQTELVRRMNGAYFPTPSLKTTTPQIEMTAAEATVMADLATKAGFTKIDAAQLWQVGGQQVKSELVIYHIKDDKTAERLVWHVSAYRNIVHRHEYFVDALTGAILHSFGSSCSFNHQLAVAGRSEHDSHSHESENTEGGKISDFSKKMPSELPFPTEFSKKLLMDKPDSANAVDLMGVTRRVQTYLIGTRYYLLDASRPMYNAATSTLPNKGVGIVITYDNRNTDDGPYYYVTSANNTWTDASSVSAHFNAGLAYEYFRTTHARRSINGKNGSILGFVNVTDGGRTMDNAYWNGEAMFYGNGGSAFFPLARGLDVAGHEMSHGVIQNSANLTYENESGALNESFADVFGIMIDRDDWEVGEDVIRNRTIFTTGLLRSFTNPNNGGTSLNSPGWQPKHVNQQYRGQEDNGGVHINSGITNYAFYLFASNGSVGKVVAERVYYRALTVYLSKSSIFLDCRASVEQAVKDLYPNNTTILTAAQTAFTQVGIGTGTGGSNTGGSAGGTAYQQNFPVNPGADYIVYVTDDNSKLMLYNPSTGANPIQLSGRGIYNKPSITDDGTIVTYIGNDRKMYATVITWTGGNYASHNDQLIQNQAIWNQVTISKDGKRIAANTGDSTVSIFILGTSNTRDFKLYNPTFTQGVNAGVVKECDALEFDHFGEFVMYDAQTVKKGSDGSNLSFWDIGLINVWSNKTNNWGTGKVEKLFTDLPENTSIANPTFAKNAAYIVAFDFIDASTANTEYYILAANIQNGKSTQANSGIVKNNVLGYPSYSRQDNRVLFTNESLTGIYQLQAVNMAADKLEPASTNRTTVRGDAQFGVWFGNGKRLLVSTQDLLDEKAISVAPNPFRDQLSLQISADETTAGTVEILDLLGRTVSKTPLSILAGKNNIDIETRHLAAGTYLLKATVGAKMRTVKIVKQ